MDKNSNLESGYPSKKYTNRNFIVHCKPVPELYGNLRFFCLKNKIPYSTYSKKSFPFDLDGYAVCKVVRNAETIHEYILKIIHEKLNNHKARGCFLFIITDELVNVHLDFCLFEDGFIVKEFKLNFPNVVINSHSLTI